MENNLYYCKDLYYCERCGLIRMLMVNPQGEVCEFCKSNYKPIPKKYSEDGFMLTPKEQYILREELVKTSPLYNEDLFNKSILWNEARMRQWEQDMRTIKEFSEQRANALKCPTCQSTSIRRIGGIEKGISIWAFGLFSSKIGKTFKCNSCGYTW